MGDVPVGELADVASAAGDVGSAAGDVGGGLGMFATEAAPVSADAVGNAADAFVDTGSWDTASGTSGSGGGWLSDVGNWAKSNKGAISDALGPLKSLTGGDSAAGKPPALGGGTGAAMHQGQAMTLGELYSQLQARRAAQGGLSRSGGGLLGM